jgi:hypothetical protein
MKQRVHLFTRLSVKPDTKLFLQLVRINIYLCPGLVLLTDGMCLDKELLDSYLSNLVLDAC